MLSVLGLAPSGAGSGVPATPIEFVTAALALVRREIDRLFFNDPPSVVSVQTSQGESGVVTGSIIATDPQDDPLAYSVSRAPSGGSVVVDPAGNFTYTAAQDLVATGGTDTFVIAVRDTGFHLNFWAPTTTKVPIEVTIAAAQPVSVPGVSIADATAAEGDSGTSPMSFTVTLSKASADPVSVSYATSNGTATAGTDYAAGSGTVMFAPGVTSRTVAVAVNGDADVESDETFAVTLSDALGATIADATAVGTIVNDDVAGSGEGGTGTGGVNSGNAGDELWGEAYFAPYVDMAGWPTPDLVGFAQDHGVSLLTLAFVQATSDGVAAWGGYSTLAPDSTDEQAQAINDAIVAFQGAGGDVMVSFGGANGTTLAQSYAQQGRSAQELADAYGGVVDAYRLNRIDFDVEGAAVADPDSIALRSAALALLQQDRPDLEIWYTLPVLPTGLTSDGINVVRSALDAGVKIDGVNVMAMDYGESAAPTSGSNAQSMGAYAIDSAESTYAQLSSLYAGNDQEFGWNQLGVTPMIGVNDVATEVFTVDDAQALEDFANQKGLGMISMWSITRDTPGSLGYASPTASGLDDPAGSFSGVFNDYGAVNDMDLSAGTGSAGSGTPVQGGTTTVVGWHWGTDTVLSFDPAIDKLDFGWMQPDNFEVSEASGSTQISIANNRQTYTLDGVALSELQMGNITALDTNTLAKWQDLINNATRQVSM